MDPYPSIGSSEERGIDPLTTVTDPARQKPSTKTNAEGQFKGPEDNEGNHDNVDGGLESERPEWDARGEEDAGEKPGVINKLKGKAKRAVGVLKRDDDEVEAGRNQAYGERS